jgi:hypothetical protein
LSGKRRLFVGDIGQAVGFRAVEDPAFLGQQGAKAPQIRKLPDQQLRQGFHCDERAG